MGPGADLIDRAVRMSFGIGGEARAEEVTQQLLALRVSTDSG
jgi:hypothetical protein